MHVYLTHSGYPEDHKEHNHLFKTQRAVTNFQCLGAITPCHWLESTRLPAHDWEECGLWSQRDPGRVSALTANRWLNFPVTPVSRPFIHSFREIFTETLLLADLVAGAGDAVISRKKPKVYPHEVSLLRETRSHQDSHT